mmetsp:Transcript_58168/g.165364  ORF Transcript_58168/g.165364 Transcript_58168/m.165364 type:complete len:321 (-) Transcript_58168:852-1814(-)
MRVPEKSLDLRTEENTAVAHLGVPGAAVVVCALLCEPAVLGQQQLVAESAQALQLYQLHSHLLLELLHPTRTEECRLAEVPERGPPQAVDRGLALRLWGLLPAFASEQVEGLVALGCAGSVAPQCGLGPHKLPPEGLALRLAPLELRARPAGLALGHVGGLLQVLAAVAPLAVAALGVLALAVSIQALGPQPVQLRALLPQVVNLALQHVGPALLLVALRRDLLLVFEDLVRSHELSLNLPLALAKCAVALPEPLRLRLLRLERAAERLVSLRELRERPPCLLALWPLHPGLGLLQDPRDSIGQLLGTVQLRWRAELGGG